MARNTQVEMLETMYRIREFESRAQEHYADGEMPGFIHLYIGQEAVASGVCQALDDDDYITSTHRGHGHCIAKGLDPSRMMAELYGKETGYCNGKGGSMHIADIDEAGMLGANGIVASGIPIAVGGALSAQLRGTDQVSVAFFGEGALEEGAFHEAMNLASVWDLPFVGVIENNFYVEMSRYDAHHQPDKTVDDLTVHADSYGMEKARVDGMDVEEVHGATAEAVDRARNGGGPTLIECVTYRFEGHHEGDTEFYRDQEEVEEWRERDPIKTYPQELIEQDVLSEDEWADIRNAVEAEIQEAIEFARESPLPEPEQAYENLFTEGVPQ